MAAGPLRSSGVTRLRRSYGPIRHPLVVGRFPGGPPVIRPTQLPALSGRDEEGFARDSIRPGHRAVAPTPPERVVGSASVRQPVLPSPCVGGLGLRGDTFRGHLCVRLRYGPVTRSPSQGWLCRWVSGYRFPSSLPSKLRGCWLLPRQDLPASAGLAPAERISLTSGHTDAPYQPRRALSAVGSLCMRLFGARFGSTRRFISSSEMVRPAANSARERAMRSRNSG